mmetsp:Transcript_10022/g.15045  ORF Transcript_10022/g.15045 Transcript_10022/m.15045 type:complete len:460 (-) Transcript_10022:146-1525(-)
MRSTLLSLLITFSPLLLIHDHGALAQCSKTWTLPSSGLKGDAYQVFGECRRRGDIGIAWKTTGLDGDKYKVILKSGSANVEYAVERTGASSGSSHAIKRGNGWYGHVVFQCRKGGVFPGKCEMGTLQYKIVDCACPTNMKPTSACNFSKFESAKDVQCESLPPPPKPYRFEYEVKDFTFEPTPLNSIETEKISTSSNGIIKNCADGVTAEHTLDMSLSIENTQSMTVSKSFTSSKMQEIAAGVSVTVEAQAGAIFASTSVAATAKLETKHSWEESATEEESMTMEKTSTIEFTLAATVMTEPNTCAKYTLSSNVSSEPVTVPYTATVYLTVKHNDQDQEQVRDLETLRNIQDTLAEYDATIDPSSYEIVYQIEGVYSGLYATKSATETSNCDYCSSSSSSTSTSKPTEPPTSVPATTMTISPLVKVEDADESSSPSGGLAVGINAFAVGVLLAVAAFCF